MLKILKQAIKAGVITNSFPEMIAEPPDGFRGRPVIDFSQCTACDQCSEVCPTNAISIQTGNSEKIVTLSYGDCIFCGECETACPDTIHLTKEFQLAVTNKSDLVTQARYTINKPGNSEFAGIIAQLPSQNISAEELGKKVFEKVHHLLNRSLHIREVDAGSCNGCEIEITALNNPIYDIERFGIHFVASPRHADMLLVTGPVTRNMEIALRQAYDATPDPKLVVAVGACGIGGGIFGQSYASCGGVDKVVPVDVYIPGCPPRPEALLYGILLAMNRLSEKVSPH